jgi:hypothetical protein
MPTFLEKPLFDGRNASGSATKRVISSCIGDKTQRTIRKGNTPWPEYTKLRKYCESVAAYFGSPAKCKLYTDRQVLGQYLERGRNVHLAG